MRGLTVAHFEDLDFSGASTKRPQFQAMLERLERGDVAVVAAYSLSRISRSVSDFSISTVGNLAANAYKKLGVHGAAAAVHAHRDAHFYCGTRVDFGPIRKRLAQR